MDKYLLQIYTEQFQDRFIRLDPYIFNKIGIYKDQTILKIEDYFINCVPFELSLKYCKVLVVFNSEEIDFFDKYKDKRHSLHLKFLNPLFPREISLFLKVAIKHVEILNKTRNQASIELEFAAPANDFLEIMVELYLEMEKIEKYLKNQACSDTSIEGGKLKEIYMDDHAYARWGENEDKSKAKIISISMNKTVVFRELKDPKWVKKYGIKSLELRKGGTIFNAGCTVKKIEALDAVPDFYYITLELDDCFSLCDVLLDVLDLPSLAG